MLNKNYFYLLSLIIFLFLSIRLSFACDIQNLKIVKFNDKNQAVGELQKCLNELGFSIKSGITNFFGKETQQALKNFYKQMLNIDVDGKNFGTKGLRWFKSNYPKLATKFQTGFLIKVSSKEDLKKRLTESTDYYDYFRLNQRQTADIALLAPSMSSLELSTEKQVTPSRYSETNVQVKDIDEPDIVKNDGLHIYFANEKPILRYIENVFVERKTGINIIKAFPPKDISLLTNITSENKEFIKNLLLDKDNKILITFGYKTINAYNIATPGNPEKIWNYEYAENNELLTARLYQGKIYLFLRSYIDRKNPCPLNILNNPTNQFYLNCNDFYIPREPIANNISYSIFILDPKSGHIDKKVSFIGALTNSVIYVSPKNIYVTYHYYENFVDYILDFYTNELKDILPSDIIDRITKLKIYDISKEAKIFEINLILNKYINTLSNEKNFDNEIRNRFKDYLTKNLKNFEKTAIVKIDINNLEIKKTGYIPGKLLNQFSLDEYNDYLRTAVTLGERNFFFSPIQVNITSTNAVYILDSDLNIVGNLENLGLTERIYGARFYGTRGYLVTFRQIDPFYVLDLSNPKNPLLKGELKIPGYSSYLEELDNNLVLGIGQENFKVKVSLFDINDASNPIELDKYILDDRWSEILNNHRAFLKDKNYKIFFLPSSYKAYIFSYDNKKLKLEKEITSPIKRAIYIDNYLYLISNKEIIVLNENNWQEEAKLKLNDDDDYINF